MQIFRKDGTFVSEHAFEKNTRGTGSVYDLVFSPDKEQFIYMIDGMNGEVRIVDRASKETLGRFGRPGRQVGMFTALHNIAVDRQGNIFTPEVKHRAAGPKFRRLDLHKLNDRTARRHPPACTEGGDMSKELYWLTLTAAMTALLWVPYILDRIMVRGTMGALANPSVNDNAAVGLGAADDGRAHEHRREPRGVRASGSETAQALNIHTRFDGIRLRLLFLVPACLRRDLYRGHSRAAHAVVFAAAGSRR